MIFSSLGGIRLSFPVVLICIFLLRGRWGSCSHADVPFVFPFTRTICVFHWGWSRIVRRWLREPPWADSGPSSGSQLLCFPLIHVLWQWEPLTAGSLCGSGPRTLSGSVPAVLTDVLLVSYLTLNVVFPTDCSLPGCLLQEASFILLSQRQLEVSHITLTDACQPSS